MKKAEGGDPNQTEEDDKAPKQPVYSQAPFCQVMYQSEGVRESDEGVQGWKGEVCGWSCCTGK